MDFIDYTLAGVCVLISILTLYKLLAIIYTSYTYSRIDQDSFFKDYKATELGIKMAPHSSAHNELSVDQEALNFKVFCASERSLARFFNLFPWESIGLLSFDGNDISFIGYKSRSTRFFKKPRKLLVRYRFPKNQVRISYIPPNFLKDGGLEWLKLEAHRHKFYFTSGHSKKIKPKSNVATTRKICEIVSDF